ncbi:MAG: DUF4345 family protein [Anaerolineae bacterium]|nr:MAG: DUF4345 family protein [Anaerolineae bacterium]
MKILEILKIIAVVGTIVTGLFSLIRPRSVIDFTGLSPQGGRGVTEIRAVLGGAFIGLGVAPLLLKTPAAYQMLGITYLAIAIARAPAMIIDQSVVASNIISLAVEIIFGVILVL